jgi:Asp-tRNA(Asn)/Glu-tRNA(Gln) amidotransferase A subunit family amidase
MISLRHPVEGSRMKDELISFDAIALGELVLKKEVRPTELLEITMQRIEKINPKLNAVIHKMYDQARETAINWTTALQES